jgi:hypothetical protein
MSSDIAIEIQSVVNEQIPIVVDMAEKKAVEAVASYTNDIKLNPEQEAIVSIVYDEAKSIAEVVLRDTDLPVIIKVTKLIGSIMTILQKTRHNGAKLLGGNKKIVALYLLHRFSNELVQDDTLRAELFDTIKHTGGQLLETLVGVSKGFKEAIDVVSDSSCCDSLMKMFSMK